MDVTRELTRNQELVFGALSNAGGPLSAYSILDRLRDDGFRAPLQVYRALDKLIDYGLVHRLESLNAFVACSHAHCASRGLIAFGICETCGKVWEFEDSTIEQRIAEWADRHRFAPKHTTIEIRGLCRDCEPV